MVEVRPIVPDEWRRLKEIRLEALAESPLAFTTTLDEAKALPDAVWHQRASGHAHGVSQVTMIGIDGSRTVGMAVGLLRDGAAADVVPIVSVFVSPLYRGQGVGRRVMEGVEDWARHHGAGASSLWVVDENHAARRFYECLGYRATLDRQKITVPPERWETRFVKVLSG